jgi:hypothetical protein
MVALATYLTFSSFVTQIIIVRDFEHLVRLET